MTLYSILRARRSKQGAEPRFHSLLQYTRNCTVTHRSVYNGVIGFESAAFSSQTTTPVCLSKPAAPSQAVRITASAFVKRSGQFPGFSVPASGAIRSL